MRTARSSRGRSALVVGAAALALGTLALGGAASAASRPRTSSGDAGKAAEINVRASDLPKSQKWTASSVPASSPEPGRKAVACIKKGGGAGAKASPDLFGTVGKPSGSDTADVTSKMFGPPGTFTGLPSVTSEVVFAKTAKQALADLAAYAAPKTRGCLVTLTAAITAAQSGGTPKVTASTRTLPHLGAGSGGLHLRFVVTGGQIPGKLYQDAYYYVEGRAEIVLTFVNLTSPFSPAWATSIATKLMARAKSVAG